MSVKEVEIELSPTQEAYVFSEAVVVLIYSSLGEGKTYASVMAMIHHAKRNGKPIRCAIVRDTHENIKTTTVRSIQDALDPISPKLYRFKNDYKELTIYTNPPVYVDLFGIDDPASLGKLQGPEHALIWLEEPAPMVDKANAGLSEDVFNAGLVRCARQKGTIPRLQISMNPADEDHWTYKRFFIEALIDPDNPLITKAIFRVPYGENKHLTDIARQASLAAYRYDKESFTRYCAGRFASKYAGKKVTPNYDPDIFLAKLPIIPAVGLEGFRGWDGWHNPSCLLGQVTTTGRAVFIDTLRGEACDVRTLIEDRVKPQLNHPRWKGKCKSWRDIGDISMRQPDQSNKQESAAKVIERAFGTSFEPGPKKWDHIKIGVGNIFSRSINGMPPFVINPEERWLHKALSGGWHYKTDNSGNIIGKIPMKNEFSHIGDAWANVINVLMPATLLKVNKDLMRRMNQKARRRAESY
jgi:hypothetical protein